MHSICLYFLFKFMPLKTAKSERNFVYSECCSVACLAFLVVLCLDSLVVMLWPDNCYRQACLAFVTKATDVILASSP